MEIFDTLVAVFDFIFSILNTIIDGITGCVEIVLAIISFLNSICRILPSPLYQTFLAFLSVYSTIFVYKIFRQG